MAIPFASSDDIDFVQLAGTLDTSPGSMSFDTNYVRSVFTSPAGSPAAWRQVFDSAMDDFWHQFRWRCGVAAGAAVGTITYFDVANDRPILRLMTLSGVMTLQYWDGAAWQTVGAGLPLTTGAHYVFTVRCKIHPTNGHFAFLVGGAVQAEVTGDTQTLVGGAYSVQWATWAGAPNQGGNPAQNHWAEVILTTGDESPVGMRVRTHTLTADGTNTDWSGASSDVDEVAVSTADVASSDAAGQVSTYALDDLPVALGANVVRGVMVTAYARCGATGPQNLQLSLQTNGGTHSSPTQALTTGYRPVRYMFEGNPATSAEFTAPEIDALEAGVTSVA